MPRTPKDDQQPSKKGGKKPEPPAESYLTGSEPDAPAPEPAEQRPTDEPTPEEIKAGAAKLTKLLGRLGYVEKEPREDVKRNRAKIRAVMIDYIKNELRVPTNAEISEATGLSEKTIKAHKKHIKLGDGKTNIYQALTHDVIMSLYKKAKGYTLHSEKLLVVSQGKGEPSEVERHNIDVHYPADVAAAKLWLQAIEGMSDKSETKHSGEIKGGGAFVFEYVVPDAPGDE